MLQARVAFALLVAFAAQAAAQMRVVAIGDIPGVYYQLAGRFIAYYSGGEQQVLLAPAGDAPAPVHSGGQNSRRP
ncbi:MAG: hypothetical protein LAO07_13070 [Acidobacteriia bacterium]|nr:hypothetical protein [Terriglobia bacterium]